MSQLRSRLDAELRERDALGLRRELRVPSGLDLCSNDYLRLSVHPHVKARMAEAIRSDGCGSGGSRVLGGHREVFSEVETAFAAFKGAERALYFSSGYLANLAVLSTLTQRHDRILSDRLNHASLRDGARLSPADTAVFPHTDGEALGRLLGRSCDGHTFVVTESLFSMDGDTPPLADYAERCRRAGATLVVDEAHAVGLYGERGSGLMETARLDPNEVVSINTAGKALGVSGAFVAGSSSVIEYLVQRARPFVFSTAPPPGVAAALLASMAIIRAEPERRCRVLALARHLRTRLSAAGFAVAEGDSPIVPIVLGGTARTVAVAEDLQGRGFDVRAIRPPTVPAGTARLRLSVNAGLSETQLDALVEALSCHVASS